MGKNKTLVKNKRKKRQTKKRHPKKYMGGDINAIMINLRNSDPKLRQQIIGCLDGVEDCPQKKYILRQIDKSNILKDAEKEELKQYVILYSQAEFKSADKQLWDDIKNLLNTQCGNNVETSHLEIRDGTNRVNTESAFQNVKLAGDKFKKLKESLTDYGVRIKEKEFYDLLRFYAINRCNNIKVIRESVLKLCLDYYKNNSLNDFYNIIDYNCNVIIYNIDYSSWSGWRDQIISSITRVFEFLNLYKLHLTIEVINKVKMKLLEKICKIITFKRKSFLIDNKTCDDDVKTNNDDYKRFSYLIDEHIKALSSK